MMDIVITDITAHSFTIKLNWDICIMKQHISNYYEKKIFSEYLIINNISNKDFSENITTHLKCWVESEDYKRINNYCPTNIELIYNGNILEQYHVEADLITLEDLKTNSNMNFVLTKKEQFDEGIDNDNNSIYSNGSDSD